MQLFVVIVTLCLLFALVSGLAQFFRKLKNRKVLNRYIFEQDEAGLLAWIAAQHTAARLLWVLEALMDRDAYEEALSIYCAFPFDAYPERHIRFFASRLYAKAGDFEPALQLAERLHAQRPNDDAVLDLLIHAAIGNKAFDRARALLIPRLQRKLEGTIFQRHYAKLLVQEGKDTEAAALMREIVQKEFILFSNTIAQPAKRHIRNQYEESRAFLDEIHARLGMLDSEERA